MSATAAPAAECAGLTVEYGGQRVLQALDLVIAQGEMLAVLGPSGSGKSTLLHAVAGFVAPLAGEIRIAGVVVTSAARMVPPERRSVGVVFQSFALWPHLNVLDTVAYPARRRGLSAAAARAEAGDLVDRLGLGELRERRPAELSGGEQQRVGLARALARQPALFLFDEPTSQLDTSLRASLQSELAEQRRRLGAAAIFATHDFEEALALADRVALLRAGRLVQAGSPAQVYERPVDPWSAMLTGPASILDARVLGAGRVEIAGQTVELQLAADPAPVPGPARLLVRPDWARLGGPLTAVVKRVLFRGAHTDYHLKSSMGEVALRELGGPRARAGEETGWTLTRAWVLGDRGAGLSP